MENDGTIETFRSLYVDEMTKKSLFFSYRERVGIFWSHDFKNGKIRDWLLLPKQKDW